LQRKKTTVSLAPGEAKKMKQRMLNWANQFSILLFLDSNNYPTPYGQYECLLAVEPTQQISGDSGDLLVRLKSLHAETRDWVFGHICYDYKNILEPKLASLHKAKHGYPLLYFFIPQTVCYIDRDSTTLTIESFIDPSVVYNQILSAPQSEEETLPQLQFTGAVSQSEYLTTIDKLRTHIADGDCYEINFCSEGYCEQATVEPLAVFRKLNELSPAPFAAYYRLHKNYMMCASPERYVKKNGNKVLSQPIKGTARRDADAAKDEQIKKELKNNIKERAENVMIVDLVRNDLAHCCETGSIKVDELFGIYTFPQVHQMISTVSGTLNDDVPLTDALRYSFPMGSMTGAPMFKVMQLIDNYEQCARELFSGTVGYITPDGDFDFNVIIRSLFYNQATKYLSYQTGGAITYDSNPQQEWEEMRLKAWALERIFS
jgi:para-aminobenzoate synthetase component 1